MEGLRHRMGEENRRREMLVQERVRRLAECKYYFKKKEREQRGEDVYADLDND